MVITSHSLTSAANQKRKKPNNRDFDPAREQVLIDHVTFCLEVVNCALTNVYTSSHQLHLTGHVLIKSSFLSSSRVFLVIKTSTLALVMCQ